MGSHRSQLVTGALVAVIVLACAVVDVVRGQVPDQLWALALSAVGGYFGATIPRAGGALPDATDTPTALLTDPPPAPGPDTSGGRHIRAVPPVVPEPRSPDRPIQP